MAASPTNSVHSSTSSVLRPTNSVHHAEIVSPVGLIAGNGSFPIEFAQNARKQGLDVVAVAHRGETRGELQDVASVCEWVRVGQLNRIVKTFRRSGVRQVAFAGGITRIRNLFDVRLDWRAVRVLSRIRSVRDDALLRGIAGELEREGLEVISATVLLHESVAHPGSITRRHLTQEEREDARIGWEVAKALGAYDVGQTVVVAKGVVVALEGIDGTDALLTRSGELLHGGGVVVKVSKPQQDLRLDLPTVGPKTVETMRAGGLKALVLEAEKTLLLEPTEIVRLADEAGIAIEVFAEQP